MAIYLSFKEIWRNKGRFLLFSLVIALITTLVLFIAGLAEGLATANREYLAKLDGELIVFQSGVKLSTLTSRLSPSIVQKVERIEGVAAVGPVGLSNAALVPPGGSEDINISLIGVEPGKPGGAPALQGRALRSTRGNEVVIDGNLAKAQGLGLGDTLTIKSIQGADEEYYAMQVVGITDGRQYFFQPSIFLPMDTWNEIRPQGAPGGVGETLVYNILAVQLENPKDIDGMAARIQNQVDDIETADLVTAYEATPGYAAQQSTLNTQRGFTLLIGILVIGGFFQIQTLQKIPNIGMLKAIGAGNRTVGLAVITQIVMVTVLGVALGSLATFGLAAALPGAVPILFTQQSAIAAIVSLTLIGPIGGLVSVWLALKAEPLMALGLSS